MSAPSLRSPIVKDALTSLDFSPDKGIRIDQVDYFFDLVTKEPKMMVDNKVERMNGPEKRVPKIGLSGHILHNIPVGEVATTSQEAKPTPSVMTLNSKEMVATIPVTDDALEDNVEGAGLDAHVSQIAVKGCANDMEYVGLLADPASTNDDLKIMSGLLLQATTSGHLLDYTDTPWDVNNKVFMAGLNAMPVEHLQDEANMRFYISRRTWQAYTDWMQSRLTILGDQYMTSNPMKVPFNGVPFYVLDWMPANTYLLTHKDNVVWGIQRSLTVEKERLARGRISYYVMSVRFDVQFMDANGVVIFKGLNEFTLST